jgi:hypothetical protein
MPLESFFPILEPMAASCAFMPSYTPPFIACPHLFCSNIKWNIAESNYRSSPTHRLLGDQDLACQTLSVIRDLEYSADNTEPYPNRLTVRVSSQALQNMCIPTWLAMKKQLRRGFTLLSLAELGDGVIVIMHHCRLQY